MVENTPNKVSGVRQSLGGLADQTVGAAVAGQGRNTATMMFTSIESLFLPGETLDFQKRAVSTTGATWTIL